jgi:integrase
MRRASKSSAEIVQLRVRDVQEIDGILCLLIRRSAGSIKTDESHRDVPVHPAMRSLVLSLRDKAIAAGQERLFPAHYECEHPDRTYTQNASRYIRKTVGIKDRYCVMYSGRHYFRWKARQMKMDGAVSRAIQGHKIGDDPNDIHDTVYGSTPPPLAERFEWISKFDPLA